MKNRIEYLDTAKGIGILLVVLGHVIPRGIVWSIIYNFHMPFFIFCSGIFFDKSKTSKRIFHTTVDYISLSLFGIFIWFLLFENIIYIKQSIFNIFVGGFSPYHSIFPVEALWYLPCLILIILEYHFISKIENLYIRSTVIIFIAVLGLILLNHHNTIPSYYNLDISFFLLPFYYVGNVITNNSKILKLDFSFNRTITFFLIGIIIYTAVSIFNGNVNIYKAFYGKNFILYYFAALLGITLFLLLSNFICIKLHILSIPLSFIGKHTLVIMATHQLFINIVKKLFENNTFCNVFAFITSVLLSLFCSIIYNKFKNITWRKIC